MLQFPSGFKKRVLMTRFVFNICTTHVPRIVEDFFLFVNTLGHCILHPFEIKKTALKSGLQQDKLLLVLRAAFVEIRRVCGKKREHVIKEVPVV